MENQRIGAVAQLGARLHGMQEVTGSIPVSSTFKTMASPIPVEPFYLIKAELKPFGEEIALVLLWD